MRVPIALHPHQHLVLSVFSILAILIGVQLYLVVLFHISLMTYDVEHLFICLLAICIYTLVRCLSNSLTYFLIESFVFLLLSFKFFCTFWITDLYQTFLLKYFLPACGLSPNFLDHVFCREELLNFNEVFYSV